MSGDGTQAAIPVDKIIDFCETELSYIEDTRKKRKAILIAKYRKGWVARWFYKNKTDEQVFKTFMNFHDAIWADYGWSWEDDVRRVLNLANAAKKSSTIMMISSRDYAIVSK